MIFRFLVTSLFFGLALSHSPIHGDQPSKLDINSTDVLSTPKVTEGAPAAGKRVSVTPPEHAQTQVYHTLYLPEDWQADGPPLPIIFEYTGNYHPNSGSTGRAEDAGLGYGLSGGKYIWVSLPYVAKDHQHNEGTWWGDQQATIQYAKINVPRIVQQYNADPNAVFLCGFSRGAIAVNYIGLHDDEISRLWTGFITHDHFDGVKKWGNSGWGAPLDKYRTEALVRLQRVADRPYLVSQNGKNYATRDYLKETGADLSSFTFSYVRTDQAIGPFPNELAKAGHNDRWLNKPSTWRSKTWQWMNQATAYQTTPRDPAKYGTLIFEDQFERNESQEQQDEPGNAWTTSSDKTAGGNKQVDLRDGTMHIYTHATANHATSVRHEFEFRDGTMTLRFKLHTPSDQLTLNFVDHSLPSTHAGHLFNVVLNADSVSLSDRMTGAMNKTIRKARKAGELTAAHKATLATKQRSFPVKLSVGDWHTAVVHVDGERLSIEVNQQAIGSYSSAAFGHAKKAMIRLLVPQRITVDDLRVYRRK